MGSTMKYSDLDLGTIEAIMNRLGGMEGAKRFLRGELVISELVRKWREENGVINLGSVTSDGATGQDWIERLEKKGFKVGNCSKSILLSADFKPTIGVATEVVVLKGELFSNDRVTRNIRAEADKRDWLKPNTEVACLIREKFTDKEIEAMGLWGIVVMHEPIKDSGGRPGLFSANRRGGGCRLSAFCGGPFDRWSRGGGFAFAVPQ
jgi:hypothetical protein